LPRLRSVCVANPEQPFPHAYLAAAYGLKGETRRADAELAQARRLSVDDRYSSIARLNGASVFANTQVSDLA
jgi:predicted negative regulator of RcsB-dependent stress response